MRVRLAISSFISDSFILGFVVFGCGIVDYLFVGDEFFVGDYDFDYHDLFGFDFMLGHAVVELEDVDGIVRVHCPLAGKVFPGGGASATDVAEAGVDDGFALRDVVGA